MKYKEIESIKEVKQLFSKSEIIKAIAFQDIDFTEVKDLLKGKKFTDCIFLGCTIPDSLNQNISPDCLVFPEIDVPFNPYVSKLYNRKSLYNNYQLSKPESYLNTHDKQVYDHYIANGKEANDIKETLARRLHDHSVTDALYDFLADYDERKVVAIMGGHGLLRSDENFIEVARISKLLTEKGYLMVSGGGPGAMEATHIGAWFANKKESELLNAIKILSDAPAYTHELWLDKAFEVLDKYPESNYKSLGIPTWLYGHEPATPFATHIAKYFANSVREDGLLTIAKGGVIYSPGSAGTIQEIFQDATQNHYLSFGYASPMVFFNSEYWTKERPIYPLIQQLADEGKFQNMILSLCNTSESVVEEIMNFTQS